MKAETGDRKPESKGALVRDFRERTFQFGIRCVRLVESLPKSMCSQTLGMTSSKRVEQLQVEANEIIAITVSSIKTARKGPRK